MGFGGDANTDTACRLIECGGVGWGQPWSLCSSVAGLRLETSVD